MALLKPAVTGVISRLGLSLVLTIQLAGGLCAEQMDEYHVKAAFLYNFAKFVEWPAESFPSPGAPFTICVLGEDPFGHSLDEMVAGRSVGGRSVTVRRISDPRQTGGCHVLFIGSALGKRNMSVLAAQKQTGVLTVGELEGANSEDVMISFTEERGKVRFQINLIAAEGQRLHLSSKLLSLATVVRR